MTALPDDEVGIILGRLTQLWREFLSATPRLAASLVVLVLTWAIAKGLHALIGRALRRSEMRASLRELAQQLIYASIWIGGLLIAAIVLFPSLTPGRAIAGLGIGSIAVGFAFKDIFENFFAGILILWRFPFEIGDFVRCGEISGKVEFTNVRMTLVRQVDGRLLIVPNSRLFKDPVEVLTAQDLARVEITVGIGYAEDVESARSIMSDAMSDLVTVAQSKPIDIQVRLFNTSSVDFGVYWWTGSEPQARRESVDEVHTAIKIALDRAGIEIPFPQRTISFDQNACVEVAAGRRETGSASDAASGSKGGEA